MGQEILIELPLISPEIPSYYLSFWGKHSSILDDASYGYSSGYGYGYI